MDSRDPVASVCVREDEAVAWDKRRSSAGDDDDGAGGGEVLMMMRRSSLSPPQPLLPLLWGRLSLSLCWHHVIASLSS